MSKYRNVLFVLMIALALLALVTPNASAAPKGTATVTLALEKTSFAAGESVLVKVSVANNSQYPVKVLKWFTPAEDVEEPLFTVTRDGQAVQYIGAIYKRPAPQGTDYITLKAGDSFTKTVDIAQYYDFSVAGNYAVEYSVDSSELYEKTDASGAADKLVSNKVELFAEGTAAIQPLAVTGSTTYNKCTTTQQSTLVSARSQASSYAANALSYLNSGKTGSRYTTWFGIYDASRYNTAKTHFSAISVAMDTAAVKFDCGCKKKYYAYVYPNQPYVIYLCSVFWTAPLTGTDSKAGTLIHEMSHFDVVAGTDDFVYGQTGAKSLAISDPNKAVNNADNHEYFAENTPALP